MAEELEGEVAQRYARAFEELAGVGFGHGEAEELACGFEDALLPLEIRLVGFAREGVDVADEVLEVVVVDVGLEAQLVLEGHGVGGDHVEAVDFGQEVLLAQLGVLVVPLVHVDPDEAGEVLGREGQLRPVLAAVVVALVGCGAAEAERETDDEAEDGEEELVDADWRFLAGVVWLFKIEEAYGRGRTWRSA